MLFTVGSKEEIRIVDAVLKRRACSTHSKVWNSLVEAADWRDVYQKDDELFALFAVWKKDTRTLAGAPYRQTTDSFSAVHIDTELPDWMYLFCDYLASGAIRAGVIREGMQDFSGPTFGDRFRLIVLDSLLKFDFLI